MLIDLSQPYSGGMFSQKLFPPVRVERCVRIEERGVNVTCLSAGVHAATHVDAPCHFIAGGRSIEQLDLAEVSGPAIGWEVHKTGVEEITVADLEANTPKAERGDIVFIRTGWDAHFYGDHERYHHHPYLSVEAADWLIDRGVKLLAMDTATPDMPEAVRKPGFDWPIHHRLLGAGVLISEHLNRLDQVAGRRFRAFALPIPIVGSDGAPARIVAELDQIN
jgi:kynurenine formamidase